MKEVPDILKGIDFVREKPFKYPLNIDKYIDIIPNFEKELGLYGEIRILCYMDLLKVEEELGYEFLEIGWILASTHASYISIYPVKNIMYYK